VNKTTAKRKQLESFRGFKQRLTLFLWDHPLFSLNEFFLFDKDIRINTTTQIKEDENRIYILLYKLLLCSAKYTGE